MARKKSDIEIIVDIFSKATAEQSTIYMQAIKALNSAKVGTETAPVVRKTRAPKATPAASVQTSLPAAA